MGVRRDASRNALGRAIGHLVAALPRDEPITGAAGYLTMDEVIGIAADDHVVRLWTVVHGYPVPGLGEVEARRMHVEASSEGGMVFLRAMCASDQDVIDHAQSMIDAIKAACAEHGCIAEWRCEHVRMYVVVLAGTGYMQARARGRIVQ